MKTQILQITPCTTPMEAEFTNTKTGEFFTFPVLCWALIRGIPNPDNEDENFETVSGLILYDSHDSTLYDVFGLITPTWHFVKYRYT